MEKASDYDPARPLMPWLVAILINLVRAERRRSRVRTRGLPTAAAVATAAADPTRDAELEEVADALRIALAKLPPHYRDVLHLRLLHDLEPAAIARALGRPLQTVKTQLQRAKRLLRDALPAGLATSLVLALTAGRGLAATRAVVLARATHLAPALPTAGLIAGGIMMKKSIAIAAVGIAIAGTTLWFAWGPTSDAGPRPDATATRPVAVPGPGPGEWR